MSDRSSGRVATFVEAILRNRRPRRLASTAEEAEAMQAAVAMRAARPGVDLPDPRFLDRLGRRLRADLEGDRRRQAPVSRRGLLAGAGAAAAALVAGALGERLLGGQGTAPAVAGRLVADGATWRPVALAADVPDGHAVRFSTEAIQGFVVNQGGHYSALSAVCTHMGCMLRAGPQPQSLNCPCHHTSFSLNGSVRTHELPQAPATLPQIPARVKDGQVEVLAL